MRTQEVEDALRFRAHSWASEVLAAEVERLEEEVEFYKRHGQQMTDVGNGLYRAIVARLEPHFPKGSRDLEWDVLPGTLDAIAHRAEAAEARVRELEKLIDRISQASGFPIVENRGQVTETICKRIARIDSKVAELEAQNARLREALEDIEKERPVLYDMNTLLRFAGIAGDIAKATLADGKASP